MPSWVAVALMLGWVATAWVSGLTWDKGIAFRLLPILYGCFGGLGVYYTHGLAGWGNGIETIVIGAGLGALLTLCVWLEIRFGR